MYERKTERKEDIKEERNTERKEQKRKEERQRKEETKKMKERNRTVHTYGNPFYVYIFFLILRNGYYILTA